MHNLYVMKLPMTIDIYIEVLGINVYIVDRKQRKLLYK